jgi:hypothetical protein
MTHPPAATFREILESTRHAAGISAWERARQASSLRHVATARGDRRGARRLSELKKEAIRLVAIILPEQLKITLDSDQQIGLLSIQLKGHGRLHLPADTDLPRTRHTSTVPARRSVVA